jgi:hypothetical protein
MEQVENLEFQNPNRAWVMKKLDKLYEEWLAWEIKVSQIVDQPYDKNNTLDVYAEGEEMMQKPEVLQAQTLTFLNNNSPGSQAPAWEPAWVQSSALLTN